MGYRKRIGGKYRKKKKPTSADYNAVELMIIEDVENELREAYLDKTDWGISTMLDIKEHIINSKPNLINKWTQTVADIATKANNDN